MSEKQDGSFANVDRVDVVKGDEIDGAHGAGSGVTSSTPEKMSLKLILAIFALSLIYMAVLATFMTVAPIITIINRDIGPDANFTWIALSWTIAGAITVAIAGTISDVVGRRWVAIGSGVLGIIGSAVACTANSVNQVIVGMTIVGIAAGGGQNSFPAMCELVPTKTRGPVLAVVNGCCSIWPIFGTLIGQKMAENAGWRSVFYLSIALHGAGSICCYLLYHPQEPLALDGKKRRELLRDFDWVGLLGLMTGPTLALLGINWLGAGYSANDPHFYAPFIAGIVITIALGFQQAYLAKNPLLHPVLFRNFRTFTIILIVVFVGGMLFYSLLSLWPVYSGSIFVNQDPTQIGLWGIALGGGSLVGGVAAGFLINHFKDTRYMLTGGVIIQGLFIALMAIPNQHQPKTAIALACFAGIGIGWEQTLAFLLAQLGCPDEYIGFATGLLGLFRISGGATGTAIYSTVLSTELKKNLPGGVASAAAGAGLPTESIPQFLQAFLGPDPSAVATVPGITVAIVEAAADGVKSVYVSAFRKVWLITIPFAVVALLCTFIAKNVADRLVATTAMHLKDDVKSTDSGKIDA